MPRTSKHKTTRAYTKKPKAPPAVTFDARLVSYDDGTVQFSIDSAAGCMHGTLPNGTTMFARLIESLPVIGAAFSPVTFSADGPAPSNKDQRKALLAAKTRRTKRTVKPKKSA